MESFVVTWRELLFVLVLVLAIYIAELLLLMRAGRRRGAASGREAAGHAEALEAIQREIGQLREQVSRLEGEVDRLKSAQQIAAPYAHVVQMARQGLDANELAASCGISRGEAELIVALHRTQSRDQEGATGS